ncbi:MAG: glycine dehydrogenase, partial [Alphaproteobacteria bacterium]|nr:glycine dehydrogenase [Alphaproteobacteria bacterium]
SGLCSLAFTIHLALLGEAGFAKLAALNHARAVQLADRVSEIKGVEVVTDAFFNEFALRLPRPAADVVAELAARNILAGVPVSRLIPDDADLTDILLLAATECTGEDDIEALASGLEEVL